MAKVEGCWANVLNDCEGTLTKEHTPSLSFWLAHDPKANRKAKKRAPVRVDGYGVTPGDKTANDLFEMHLCDGHNSGTSDLDEEGGRLSTALANFVAVGLERENEQPSNWPRTTFSVDGPLVERWLMKMGMNGLVSLHQPIGHPTAEPGKPTRELAEMVMGHRPVAPPLGLIGCTKPDDRITSQESIGMSVIPGRSAPNGPPTFAAAAVFTVRGFRLVANLAPLELRAEHVEKFPGWEGLTLTPRLRNITIPRLRVRFELRWP